MEYTVKILDKSYKSFQFVNDEETLSLTIDDVINFKKFKFFHNDIVVYDKEHKDILKIKKTTITSKKIVGTLKVSNKMIYGLNSRKNPYYICEPVEKTLPNFLVAVNDKKIINSNKSHYVILEFNNWNQKFPYGALVKVIGEVGKQSVEYEKILNHYNIFQKKLVLDKKYKVKQNSTIYDLTDKEELKEYENITEKYTVAIDPKGCLDIDDALSYEFKNDEHIIGIHIADVSFWVDKLDLYKFIENRFFTVYCPHKKFNVFPNILSDNLFSLKYNKDRLAMSLFIYLDENYDMKRYEVKRSIVKLNKTMTYEKANNLIKTKDKQLTKMFDISKNIKKYLGSNETQEDFDSHNMIENYMLMANKLIAEFLIKNDKKPIMRIHNESKFKLDLKDCNIKNQDTLNFLNYYQMECAVYKEYNPENDYNYYHFGLNLKYYSHFTSPIRRIVDIMIHLQIKEVLTNKDSKILKKLNVDIEKINIQQKKDKKMYRELEKINIINNKLKNSEYESYIIDIKSNQISIFIPELKHLYRKQLYSKKLLGVLSQEVTNDKIVIKNINNGSEIEFNKYQKLNIKINKNVNQLDVILDETLMNIFN